jgi:hypothetical protein
MPTIRNRFFPLHAFDEHEVVSLFSKDVTGLAGELVKITTGSANPGNTDGWAAGSSVGVAIYNQQAISMRYETKMKVTTTVSGDTIYSAIGFTELSTLEYDENGQPLRYNERRAKEIGAVISGETVPIITKGIIGLWGQYIDSSLGAVQPGNAVVISRSGLGFVAAVDPTNSKNFQTANTGSSSQVYHSQQVIGKWLTSLPTATNTGLQSEWSSMGGYALLQFDTSV